MSILDTCTDACGWVTAFVAAVSYGSYGVPIKHTKHLDVHPLIFQSYKTFVMFVTCWGVKFLGEELVFTRWGLLSGFMWVVGGCGGIYGIRMAGLAIAVGTWASIMIIINFFFGILLFQEPIYDVWGTVCSFLFLILGLVGMSHYSSPEQSEEQSRQEFVLLEETPNDLEPNLTPENDLNPGDGMNYQSFESTEEPVDQSQQQIEPHVTIFYGLISLTKRQCGIAGAVMNGFMTGGSLLPLHYAGKEGFGGAKYFPSYGVGAMIANILLWILFYAVCICKDIAYGKSVKETFSEMPKWHFRALWLPGLLAGLMLSLAMFSTILTITYLGQGVGNSIVQSKILVSGLWGIFWYKEVIGAKTIAKWFASAGLCMIAIIWLSFERLEAKAKHSTTAIS
mmetsp:Transcript_2207/g.4642  ORF Transcript_2207/g.4642 Transcript_2207/m.4642 type:complete len:395 (+) Transcript_2207:143-1327(+)